jgi:S1-C subfamily serine protease
MGKCPYFHGDVSLFSCTGEEVYFTGFPGGRETISSGSTAFGPLPLVSKGIISSLSKYNPVPSITEYYYWIDKPVFPGNSGSPVLSIRSGKVVGVITASLFMPNTLRTEDGEIEVSIPDGYSIAYGITTVPRVIEHMISEEHLRTSRPGGDRLKKKEHPRTQVSLE